MGILSGNALKLIAAATMFIDHMGLMLFPGNLLLRIIGRLALPIYAYMIAEGCKYTRNKKKYFGMVFGLAVVCQTVYFFFAGSSYLSILFTFSLSILAVYALQANQVHPCAKNSIRFTLTVAGVWLLNQLMQIDYGFLGCMLPVFPAMLHNTPYDKKEWNVAMLGLGLLLLAWEPGSIQFYSLLSLPLLMLYSGKRGKGNMKYFFYIFYPAHLVVLELILMLT